MTRKICSFNTGDCLKGVTAWAGLTLQVSDIYNWSNESSGFNIGQHGQI